MSSALGSLFLSGCLQKSHRGHHKPLLAHTRFKGLIRFSVSKSQTPGSGVKYTLMSEQGGEDVTVWVDSPFFGQVLVCPFDFCLTRTPADTQDFVGIIFRSCSHQLHTQTQQKDGDKNRTCPRVSAGSPGRHRSLLCSSNVDVSDLASCPERRRVQ